MTFVRAFGVGEFGSEFTFLMRSDIDSEVRGAAKYLGRGLSTLGLAADEGALDGGLKALILVLGALGTAFSFNTISKTA